MMMINYDVIVIGSGIAGYSTALRCLENGLKTAIVSSGQSALHFSSGSIDLLSHSPLSNQLIRHPWEEISRIESELPSHPYAKVGKQNIRRAMEWFQSSMEEAGIPMHNLSSQENHFRITTLGTLKSTWLSQPYVKKFDFFCNNTQNIERIVMVSIDGFRDFQPQIAKDTLGKNPGFINIPVEVVKISLSAFNHMNRNPNDFRSIDISRVLRDEVHFKEFADQLKSVATHQDLVMIPAILGNGDGLELMNKLSQYTQLKFHEVPTMPPSLLGIRIEDALMRSFINKGGTLHKGDKVLSGEFDAHGDSLQLTQIHTQKMGDIALSARHFVLASGSFFSKGLIANRQSILEPVFGLDIAETEDRSTWYNEKLFSQNPHRFLSFGVKTNDQFIPSINGQKVNNLLCAGSILSGYNPIAHGCGGGVAISTAYAAVEKIMSDLNQEMTMKEARA